MGFILGDEDCLAVAFNGEGLNCFMRLYLANGDFIGLFFGRFLMYCFTTGLDIIEEVLLEGVTDKRLVGVLTNEGGVTGEMGTAALAGLCNELKTVASFISCSRFLSAVSAC